jgi:hypothetical protein
MYGGAIVRSGERHRLAGLSMTANARERLWTSFKLDSIAVIGNDGRNIAPAIYLCVFDLL